LYGVVANLVLCVLIAKLLGQVVISDHIFFTCIRLFLQQLLEFKVIAEDAQVLLFAIGLDLR
jgi:hypothetical protein